MFKFCTQCGARMPQENVFCTQCGAKFPVNTGDGENNIAQSINHKVVDIAPPKREQVQNITGNNFAASKTAQDEFVLGKEFMNVANPLHDYEKAIIHLRNAASLGIKEAMVYIALSHLYLAVDIIKNNPAIIAGNVNLLNTVNCAVPQSAVGSQITDGNARNSGRNHIPHNNQQNGSSGLQNMGKYAAAAAVGAVAGSMLHSATASAAENTSEHVPGTITSEDLITPDLQDYTNEALQDTDISSLDDAADHIEAYNDTEENTATEVAENDSVADSIEAADDGDFFDSDDGSLFDDLF